ncbi:MAG: transposase [Saccharospirillaceae bacterium]|nr:transposase [Pseudomonadales bacterium]NRB79958.1 transposase [Saccharospirillaceae bacterium]
MAVKRSSQIDLALTSKFHCCTRAVRAAFILDDNSDHDPDKINRRQWIEDRILFLTTVFAIDVCAYAVMSNHYHVILDVHKNHSDDWEPIEIITRWHKIYKGTELSRAYAKGKSLTKIESDLVLEFAEKCRKKLHDISWFMRNINEPLARIANKEDDCKGRFWESRFKSQALLDEQALLTCMAYVDLNPIRSNMSKTIQKSDFTSIKKRYKKAKQANNINHSTQQPKNLSKLTGNYSKTKINDIPIKVTSYIELVEWTGKQLRNNKKSISRNTPSILSELNINPEEFLNSAQHFGSQFHRMVGSLKSIFNAIKHCKINKTAGTKKAKIIFG